MWKLINNINFQLLIENIFLLRLWFQRNYKEVVEEDNSEKNGNDSMLIRGMFRLNHAMWMMIGLIVNMR